MTITKIHDDVTSSIRSLIGAINKSGRTQLLLSGGGELLRQTLSNFGGRGQYTQKSWEPLSKAYAKKVGRSNATLIKSGNLKGSIYLNRPKGNQIELFTRNKYAAAIAFGYKKRNLPPRNYFSLGNNSDRDLFNVIISKLNSTSNGSFPLQSFSGNTMRPSYGFIL